jgi:amidohydrolase
MHACGHDLHTANLLGVAYVLSQIQDQFGGTIKLIFQPAEEIGGGAQEILVFGVLDKPKVSAFLAAHVSEDLPVGQVQIKAEEVMLASSQFTIRLVGRGGHASAPHQTDDIVLAAAKLIVEMQSIPGRKINHLEPAVITVGSIHGGDRGNIIPKELTLSGTIRTQNSALREEIHAHINNLLRAQEIITGVKGIAEFRLGSGAVYNDPALTNLFTQVASNVIGVENIKTAKFPNNGSENFYRFAKEVPSVFFRLGVKGYECDESAPAHSPWFLADDAALKTGVQVTVTAALAFLQKGRERRD